MAVCKIPVQTRLMDVYLARPERQAPGPAIVLMYHRSCLDAFTRGVANRLACHGYLVAVPDVYHRCPDSVPLSGRKALLRDCEIVADVEATAAELRARADVRADRIVIMG